MKTLHLNLKREWFDMILSSVKEEEYREIKPHWCSQLIVKNSMYQTSDYWKGFLGRTVDNKIVYKISDLDYFNSTFSFKKFDTITFSNGYAKNRDQFVIELEGIHIGGGVIDWGGKVNTDYFVLRLGKIISKNF